ncbi:MAG: GlxA family transcriptional regulator [Pseudomonadota bacterium]
MPDPQLTVGFILTSRFTLCAFANFVDVLRLAADEGDRSRPIRCRWQVLSAKGDPVRSSCGVAVHPDGALGDPARFDYVVVVGGLIDEIARLDPAYVDFLRRAAAAGVPLVGVCTGAFVLHAAGLMGGYRCCVSWFHRSDFLDQFEGLAPVSNQIFVVDRDRITCSGGVSSAHLAAHLVARHLGESTARKSLNIMIIDEAMAGTRPQPLKNVSLEADDPVVRRALAVMADAIPDTLSVARLAASQGLSRRQLERRFRASLHLSPAEAGRALRLDAARNRLAHTRESVTRIAAETGFSDASHLIRTFRAAEGVTPDAWRAQHAAVAGAAE